MKNNAWTEDFAYGVGLLVTDGNLSPDGRHIEFCSKDIELINYIKKSFGIGNKVGRKKRGGSPDKSYYRIQFGSVKLYNYLVGIGLSPRRSLSLKEIKIPKELFA